MYIKNIGWKLSYWDTKCWFFMANNFDYQTKDTLSINFVYERKKYHLVLRLMQGSDKETWNDIFTVRYNN